MSQEIIVWSLDSGWFGLYPRTLRFPVSGFGAFQKLGYDVKDVDRAQDGVETEGTALIVLHVMPRRRVLGRGPAAEEVRLDGVSHQEERGDKCEFAAQDEGGKAVAQVVEGEVFVGVQMARLEEREYHGLEEAEENDDFEADELLESAAGLEDRFEAFVESEDGGDGKDGGDCADDADL